MSIKLCAFVLVVVVLTTAAIAAMDKYTVNVANNKEQGMYMTNESFFTLYRYLSDPPDKGMSNCYDSCAKYWPSFYVENLIVNPQLNSRDFNVITRTDGNKQLAYKGWPLYLYVGDAKPFETSGEGVQGLWFVVNPQNLTR